MADTILLVDAARVVEFTPPVRPSSATLVFRSPSGTSLATPAVTVDALSRTVSAAHATLPASKFTAATGSGTPVVGRSYWWTSSDDGAHEALVTCGEIDANVWTLEAPVPGSTSVQVGDLIRGARMTATIPSTATTDKAENYLLEWTVTGADSIVYVYQTVAHVARTLYQVAVTPGQARAWVTDAYPAHASGRSYGYFRRLAARASERVWKRLKKGGHLAHLINSSGATSIFEAAGEVAVRRELLTEFIVPPTVLDSNTYREQLDAELDREIADALGGTVYDADDSGSVDEGEAINVVSIPLRRS